MTPEQWRRVSDLYHAALETPPEGRHAFVEKSAPDDTVVRVELARLLEVDPEATAAIDRAALPGGTFSRLFVAPLQPDDRLAGRYRIVREVGLGGMGQVFEAFDEELNIRVALKVIRPELAGDARVVARFKQELHLSRQVAHPNVCRAYDLVRTQHHERDLLFFCMEFLDGETLAATLRRDGVLTLEQAQPIIEQIAAGLAAAHAAGVVHRDLKSSNIFLSHTREGTLRAVIADFGVAGHLSLEEQDTAARQTASGWGVGTPAYMAPEQVSGGKIGAAADQYSFGIIMYEMAVGQMPYPGLTPLQVAVRRLQEKPAAPRSVNAKVDANWEAVILRCLETDPADRFGHVEEIPQALRTASWWPRIPRRLSRLWLRRSLAAAVLMALASAAGIWWNRGQSVPLPVPARAAYERGLTALYEGNAPAAEEAFAQVIRQAPAYGAAYARRAEAQLDMERMDDARASLLQGVGTSHLSGGDKLHSDAILALLSARPDQAEKLLRERLQKADPADRVAAQLDLARQLGAQRKWKEALAEYRQIAAADPDNANVRIQTAIGYTAQRDEKAAQQALDAAAAVLAKYPNQGLAKDLAYHRARIATYFGRPDSLALAQAAVQLAAEPVDYRNVRARLALAEAISRQQRSPEADQIVASVEADAVRQNLDLIVARSFFDLARLRSTQSRLEEAYPLLQRSAEIARKQGATRTMMQAQLLYANNKVREGREGDLAEARAVLDPILSMAEKAELADLRLQALTARQRLAREDRQFEAAESLANQLLALATQLGHARYIVEARQQLSSLAFISMRHKQAEEHAKAAAIAEGSAGMGLSARRESDALFGQGQYQRALDALNRVSPKTLEVQANIASIWSEQGRSADAQRSVIALEAQATREKNLLQARQLRRTRCTVEAEWHRFDLAAKSCAAQLQEDLQQRAGALTLAAVKKSYAQAAYWGGRYDLAERLASEVAAVPGLSPVLAWHALITRAAAERKLGRDITARRQEIKAVLEKYGDNNGPESLRTFTRRRPFREFLAEIGYALPN